MRDPSPSIFFTVLLVVPNSILLRSYSLQVVFYSVHTTVPALQQPPKASPARNLKQLAKHSCLRKRQYPW